ncbi:Hypothetical predicted protein, partial [Marmota monax]
VQTEPSIEELTFQLGAKAGITYNTDSHTQRCKEGHRNPAAAPEIRAADPGLGVTRGMDEGIKLTDARK